MTTKGLVRVGIALLAIVHLLSAGCTDAGGGADGGLTRVCGASDGFTPIRFRAELPAGMAEPMSIAQGSSMTFDAMGVVSNVARLDEPCSPICSGTPSQPVPQCPTCSGGVMPSVRIEVEQPDTTRWAIVVSPQGAVAEWEAAAEAIRGKSVSLRIRYRMGFQLYWAVGFTIHDDSGLVMASEGGRYVAALDPSDTPLLTVGLGAAICREAGTCTGQSRVFSQLSFQGTSSVSVGLGQDGEFTIGSRRYGARNQGARTYVLAGTCTDIEEASPWSVWLRPSI